MALPNLANSASKATKDRVSKLGQSIGGSISPKKLARQGFDTVKNAISNEVPELAGFASSLKGSVSDFISDFKMNMQEEMGEQNHEEQKQTEKLKQIKDDTGENNDTLLQLVKLVDTRLFEQLERNEEQLAELRTLTGITDDARNISTQQLEIIRSANLREEKETKETKFKKQTETSKVAEKVKDKVTTKDTDKRKDGMSTLATFGLLRILGDLVAPLKKLVGGIAGFVGLSSLLPKTFKTIEKTSVATSKYQKLRAIAEKKRAKNEEFLKRLNLRDEKSKKFRSVNQRDRNLLNQNQGKKRKGLMRKVGAVKGIAGSIGGALASLGGIAFFVTAIFGALSGGLKSYLQGDEIKTIIAKSIKGFIVTPFQILTDLVAGMFGKDSPDVAKIYDGITTGIGKALKFLVYDIWQGEFWTNIFDGIVNKLTESAMTLTTNMGEWMTKAGDSIIGIFKNLFESIQNGLKSMSNAVIDKIPLVPEGVKDKLKFDVTTENKPNLTPKPKAQEQAGSMLQAQDAINTETNYGMFTPAGGQNSAGTLLNAPITQNNNNTTVISPNIITRNPDSPVFHNNKVTF